MQEHQIRVQMVTMMEKTEMNISGDNGSMTWSKITYWDTGYHFKG